MKKQGKPLAGGVEEAVECCLRYLDRRDYTAAGLTRKLYGKFPAADIDAAVKRMVEAGLVDDRKYAGRKAQRMITDEGRSREAAMQKLIYDGVDRETAEDAVNSVEYDGVRSAYELIRKKYSAKISSPDDRRRTVQALLRRGFTFDDIKRALSEMKEDTEEFEQ